MVDVGVDEVDDDDEVFELPHALRAAAATTSTTRSAERRPIMPPSSRKPSRTGRTAREPQKRSTSSTTATTSTSAAGSSAQLNRGEGRHALSREVCHGRRGELRQPYREGQEEQLGALGLIVNTIILYNTIYTQRALDHIAATTGSQPRDEDIERLSPLGSDHTTLTGRYRVLLPASLHDRRAYRSLNTSQDATAA